MFKLTKAQVVPNKAFKYVTLMLFMSWCTFFLFLIHNFIIWIINQTILVLLEFLKTTWHLRVVAALVLLVVTGYWLVAYGAKLLPSSPCGRSSIDLLFAPFCQWAAMIFLHCWPHKLSDQLSIEGQEGQRNQQNTSTTGSPSDKHSSDEAGSFQSLFPVEIHLDQEERLEYRHVATLQDWSPFCSGALLIRNSLFLCFISHPCRMPKTWRRWKGWGRSTSRHWGRSRGCRWNNNHHHQLYWVQILILVCKICVTLSASFYFFKVFNSVSLFSRPVRLWIHNAMLPSTV